MTHPAWGSNSAMAFAGPERSAMSVRLRFGALFQRKAPPTVGAIDFAAVSHVKKYARVAKRTVTIAADIGRLNFNDFNWLHSRFSLSHFVTARIVLGLATDGPLDRPDGPTDDTASTPLINTWVQQAGSTGGIKQRKLGQCKNGHISETGGMQLHSWSRV